jgi:succinate dehydrogenase/fumarate reductase cytochrome b subunit
VWLFVAVVVVAFVCMLMRKPKKGVETSSKTHSVKRSTVVVLCMYLLVVAYV